MAFGFRAYGLGFGGFRALGFGLRSCRAQKVRDPKQPEIDPPFLRARRDKAG